MTISQDAFEGTLFIAVGAAVGVAVHFGVKWYFGPEAVKEDDPITNKNAASWIVPKDPSVAAAAKTAAFGGVAISDKTKLAEYIEGQKDQQTPKISITGADGKVRQTSYSQGTGTNWQKPGDYLAKGMRGDCTDITNFGVSVFRAQGYPAKAVFGYLGTKDSPHVWGEVIIDGNPYMIDEEGGLQSLAAGITALTLIRPDPNDPRNFMWDENGQVAYKENWWVTSTATKPPPSANCAFGDTFGVSTGFPLPNVEFKACQQDGTISQTHSTVTSIMMYLVLNADGS